MSTVAEIEAVIAKLPAAQLNELASWLDDFRGLTSLADDLFVAMDEEEKANAPSDTR